MAIYWIYWGLYAMDAIWCHGWINLILECACAVEGPGKTASQNHAARDFHECTWLHKFWAAFQQFRTHTPLQDKMKFISHGTNLPAFYQRAVDDRGLDNEVGNYVTKRVADPHRCWSPRKGGLFWLMCHRQYVAWCLGSSRGWGHQSHQLRLS